MPSSDGQPGVKLDEFIRMWTEDGTKLVEQDRQQVDGSTWLLYSVYFPNQTQDYGRHMAMLLKVNTDSQVILLHDLENMTDSEIGGGHRSLAEWFSLHVGKY